MATRRLREAADSHGFLIQRGCTAPWGDREWGYLHYPEGERHQSPNKQHPSVIPWDLSSRMGTWVLETFLGSSCHERSPTPWSPWAGESGTSKSGHVGQASHPPGWAAMKPLRPELDIHLSGICWVQAFHLEPLGLMKSGNPNEGWTRTFEYPTHRVCEWKLKWR